MKLKVHIGLVILTLLSLIMTSNGNYCWNFTFNSNKLLSNRRHIIRMAPQLYYWEEIWNIPDYFTLKLINKDKLLVFRMNTGYGECNISCGTFQFIIHFVGHPDVKGAYQFHNDMKNKCYSTSFFTKYTLLLIGNGIFFIIFILHILNTSKSKEHRNSSMGMIAKSSKINNSNNSPFYNIQHSMRNANVMDTNNDACDGQSCNCQACSNIRCDDVCSLPECENKKTKKKRKRLQIEHEKKKNKRKREFDRQQFYSYYGFSRRTNGLEGPVMFEDTRPCDPESEYMNKALFNEPCYRVGCPLHYSKFRCFYCINEAISFIVNNQENEDEDDEDDDSDGDSGSGAKRRRGDGCCKDSCCQNDCCDYDPCENDCGSQCQCNGKGKGKQINLKGSADIPVQFSNPPKAHIVPMNTALENAPPHGILKKQKNPTVEKGNEFSKATQNKHHPVDKERAFRNTHSISKENADMYNGPPPEEEKKIGLQKINCQKKKCCNKCNNRKIVKKPPKKTNMRQYVTIKLCTACKPDDLKCVNKEECDIPIPMIQCPDENCEDWGSYDNCDNFDQLDNENCSEYQ